MAMPPVSKANSNALHRIMAELGRSMDAKSDSGSRISDGEAQKIVSELKNLPSVERAQAEKTLRDLLVNDFFTVTPQARQQFAKAFGVQTKELEPKERAELVGLASARSAFQAGVQAIAKTPQVDKKTMKRIVDGAETYLDRPAQAYLGAVLRNASKEGTLKIDSDARKDFTRWVGKLESDKSVSNWSQSFETKGSGQVDYLSALMSSSMCFEDLVAAFMMHMAGKIQDETKEKMEEVRRAEGGGGPNRAEATRPQGGQASHVDELFKKRGLDRPAGAQDTNGDGVISAAEAAKAQAKPAGAGASEPVDANYAAKTKRNLEAVVQSVHAHINDADTPGVIDAKEAKKIAEKFERLEGPVAPLVARAMVNSLRSTPGVYLESDTFKPIVSWMKKTLGEDIDLSPLPRRSTGEASDPVAKQLRASDKLEDKIAGFVVDTLLCSDVALKDKMKDLKQLTNDMFADPKAAPALEKVLAPHEGSAPAMSAAQSAPAMSAAQSAPGAAGAAPKASLANEKTQTKRHSPMPPDPWEGATTVPPKVAGGKLPLGAANPAQMGAGAGAATAAAVSGTAQNPAAGSPVGGQQAGGPDGTPSAEAPKSRQMLWEEMKNLQNELAQVMQAMSNMLNSMHQNAMNSIRSIR